MVGWFRQPRVVGGSVGRMKYKLFVCLFVLWYGIEAERSELIWCGIEAKEWNEINKYRDKVKPTSTKYISELLLFPALFVSN